MTGSRGGEHLGGEFLVEEGYGQRGLRDEIVTRKHVVVHHL